jgi:hypothetical protein
MPKKGNLGFAITGHKGFQLVLPNGWTVSVQFGPANYSDNYNADFNEPRLSEFWTAKTAEIAAWDSSGNWHEFGDDTVDGYKSVADVLEFINKIASLPASVTTPAQ